MTEQAKTPASKKSIDNFGFGCVTFVAILMWVWAICLVAEALDGYDKGTVEFEELVRTAIDEIFFVGVASAATIVVGIWKILRAVQQQN